MIVMLFQTYVTTWPPLIKIKHLSMVSLDRANYFTWKSHTHSHLRGYKLFPMVDDIDRSVVGTTRSTPTCMVIFHDNLFCPSTSHFAQNLLWSVDHPRRDFLTPNWSQGYFNWRKNSQQMTTLPDWLPRWNNFGRWESQSTMVSIPSLPSMNWINRMIFLWPQKLLAYMK